LRDRGRARSDREEKRIKVYMLPGFEIAKRATERADLQLRMQGNAFLGAFFGVSPMLGQFGISKELFRELVLKQYKKEFGKLGEALVKSNMEVMTQGFDLVHEIPWASSRRRTARRCAAWPCCRSWRRRGGVVG
jgi:pyruvate-ferredoxin/flavodoxin oxidoreductase